METMGRIVKGLFGYKVFKHFVGSRASGVWGVNIKSRRVAQEPNSRCQHGGLNKH